MKRTITLLLVAGLVAAMLGGTADAKKKKKKKAKPVATTLYLHGHTPSGDVDGVTWLVDYLANSENNPMIMDANEPSDGAPKSQNLHNPIFNTRCTGLPVGFPTWLGEVSGTIRGNATLTLHTAAAPTTTLTARLWADMLPFQACNDEYVEPASEVTVDVPAGHSEIEIEFPDLDLKAHQYLMLEVLGGRSAEAARVFYDSTDMASELSFGCIPAKGKSCTP